MTTKKTKEQENVTIKSPNKRIKGDTKKNVARKKTAKNETDSGEEIIVGQNSEEQNPEQSTKIKVSTSKTTKTVRQKKNAPKKDSNNTEIVEQVVAVQEVESLSDESVKKTATVDNVLSQTADGEIRLLDNIPPLEKKLEQEKTVEKQTEKVSESKEGFQQYAIKPIPPLPQIRIDTIVDLISAPHRQIILSDQQIQSLTLDEAIKRFRWIEGMLAWILNYDIVISDTNIWIELLVGHSSSHSDPKINARLLFERQLDFISRLVKHRRGRFMMMSETYEEIDRFATQQAPANYKDVDFSDESECRNVAARLAKRLILSMQRENRLRIEGIGSESHHSAFADPAIIRRTVELFASGKKVLLLTNDASVAIRSMGMCDDLQRHNNIDDKTWESIYAPIRPMVITMDDLKVLDTYTRQYHFLQMAAGKLWMEDVPQQMEFRDVPPLSLWMEGFRSGERYAEHHTADQSKQGNSQQKQQKHSNQQKQNNAQPKQPAQQSKQLSTLNPEQKQVRAKQEKKTSPQTASQSETEVQNKQDERNTVRQNSSESSKESVVQVVAKDVALEENGQVQIQDESLENQVKNTVVKKRNYRRKPQRPKTIAES